MTLQKMLTWFDKCHFIRQNIWNDQFQMKNDRFTTPPQQLHNSPSHGVGPSVWGPPPCEGLLYNCCTGEV
jgi:hypothetical protein